MLRSKLCQKTLSFNEIHAACQVLRPLGHQGPQSFAGKNTDSSGLQSGLRSQFPHSLFEAAGHGRIGCLVIRCYSASEAHADVARLGPLVVF